ncbi:uncharacterized protein LOC123526993 [Mercenaria mercenaria]|uniref:uncharacterized protein LOC123526993 n=1 Tax=Mercenaria mercenaria TaxID=6596 RepID=UPI00234EF73F|nr:uncharacterized protein LOC123526993 [Mercenaria mercenaria]XP_053379696.1 uncharacterized protein LOC123526993 [Mercenaria mercenaria]XP_053379697.1 uncharacterized protein LOC123526993 [Mercenaria mercenaria]XP_053379698.1 uncharacterized protein LOC123526993 [Mercenaria mercenaria]
MAEGEEVFTPNRFNILHRRMRMKREGKGILPKEILNMGEDSINLYKKALQDGKVSVYNIRVMVVGHYGVGKTTLTKRLFGEQVDITERAITEGIDVHVNRCKISVKDGTWISQKPDENRKKILPLLAKLFKKDDQEVTQPSKEMTATPDIEDPLHESTKPQEQSSQTGSSVNVDKTKEQKTTVESEDRTKTERNSKFQPESAEIMDFHPQSTNDIEKPVVGRKESVVESEEEKNAQILRLSLQKLIAECGQDDKVQGQTGELSIWDFAGQEVYYSTHQVFLSRRAIYLLVVDMSKDLDDVIEGKDDSNIDCKGEPKDKSADEEVTESADHRELDKFKTYIKSAFPKFVDYMNPVPILDCFVKNDMLFGYRETRDIKDEKITSDMNRKILEKVRSKGKCCYNNFKKCLIKTNQKWLFEFLEGIEKGEDKRVLEKKLDEAFKGNKGTNPELQEPEGKRQHTKEETNRKTVSDFIDFWLNSIHEFGSYEDEFSSYEDDKRPPVILVGTFADKLKKRKSNPEEYLTNMREVLNKKVASCHLTPKDFPIDNNVDEEYIPALKKHIFEVASGQESWGEEIPASWVTLEDILIGIKEQKLKKFLPKDELRELNRTLPVPIGDEELELFLRFHHDIGSYLYFSEDGLKESIILEPQWLIDALKCIINANSFCIRQGKEIKDKWSDFKRTAVLKPVIIDAVWGNDENKERGFKENEKLLLSYMEKLGLVAKPKVEDNCSEKVQNYIVPYMLQTTVPKDSISYSDDRDTRKSTSILCYTTAEESNERFLPLQIFNKFLCMCVQKWELHKKTERTKKETTVMIFCGGAVFNLQDGHLLYIFFHEQVIQIWITRTSKDGHKPSFSLCSDTKTQIEKILNTNCRMHTRLLPFVKCSKADLYSTEKEILFELEENSSTKESPCFCQEDENNDHFVLTSCWPHEQED